MYGGGFSMPAQPAAPRSAVAQQLGHAAAFPAGLGPSVYAEAAGMPAASPAVVPAQPRAGPAGAGSTSRLCRGCGKMFNARCEFNLCKKCCLDDDNPCRIHNSNVPGFTGGLSLRKYEEMQQQGLEPVRKRGRKRKGEDDTSAVGAAWASYYQQLEKEDPDLYQQLLQLDDAAEDLDPDAAAAAADTWPPPRPVRRPLLRDGNQLREGREVLSTYQQELEETRLWRQALYGQQQHGAQEEVQAALDRYQFNAALLQEVLGGPLLQQAAAAARSAAAAAAAIAAGSGGATAAAEQQQQLAPSSKPLLGKQQQQQPPEPGPVTGGTGAASVEEPQRAQPPANGFLAAGHLKEPGSQQHQEGLSSAGQSVSSQHHGAVHGQESQAAAAAVEAAGTAAGKAAGSSPPQPVGLGASPTAVAVEYAEVAALQLLQQLAEADAGLQAAVQQFAATHAGLLPPVAAEQQHPPATAPEVQSGDLQQPSNSRPGVSLHHHQQQEQQQQPSRPPGDPPDAAGPPAAGSQHEQQHTTPERALQQVYDLRRQQLLAEEAALAAMPVEAAALGRLVRLVAPEPGWFEQVLATATPEQQVWLGAGGSSNL